MVKPIIFTLDDFCLPSFNKFYSGVHYRRRSDMVWKWKTIMGDMLKKQITEYDIERIKTATNIRIDITVSFAKRAFDVDNCALYGKIFLDTIKGRKWVKDDSPKYINSISYTVDLSTKRDMAIYKIIL